VPGGHIRQMDSAADDVPTCQRAAHRTAVQPRSSSVAAVAEEHRLRKVCAAITWPRNAAFAEERLRKIKSAISICIFSNEALSSIETTF
jgi:hypothetical protein